MKHQFLTLCVAVLGLALAQPVMAETSGHDNSDGHHNSQSSESETPMPSAAEAWATLQNGYEEAASISDAGKLEEMHVLTDSMSGALKTLQDSAGGNDRLNLALTQVKEVIGDLHVKADGGDAAATASAIKKLKGGLALIKVNLPEEVQSGDSSSAQQCEAGMDCPMHEDMTHGGDDGHGDHKH